jgi:hypothetical protein
MTQRVLLKVCGLYLRSQDKKVKHRTPFHKIFIGLLISALGQVELLKYIFKIHIECKITICVTSSNI